MRRKCAQKKRKEEKVHEERNQHGAFYIEVIKSSKSWVCDNLTVHIDDSTYLPTKSCRYWVHMFGRELVGSVINDVLQ